MVWQQWFGQAFNRIVHSYCPFFIPQKTQRSLQVNCVTNRLPLAIVLHLPLHWKTWLHLAIGIPFHLGYCLSVSLSNVDHPLQAFYLRFIPGYLASQVAFFRVSP